MSLSSLKEALFLGRHGLSFILLLLKHFHNQVTFLTGGTGTRFFEDAESYILISAVARGLSHRRGAEAARQHPVVTHMTSKWHNAHTLLLRKHVHTPLHLIERVHAQP